MRCGNIKWASLAQGAQKGYTGSEKCGRGLFVSLTSTITTITQEVKTNLLLSIAASRSKKNVNIHIIVHKKFQIPPIFKCYNYKFKVSKLM